MRYAKQQSKQSSLMPWAFSILDSLLKKGIGSVVNLRPQKKYTIIPYIPLKSDSDRLRGDWEKVGQSIQKAIPPNK